MHMLKCVDPYYDDVARGDKVHELRLNDRDFRVGDVLWIRRWHPVSLQYDGRVSCFRLVTYIMHGPWPHGRPALMDGWCIMSMRPTDYRPKLWPAQDDVDWQACMRNA